MDIMDLPESFVADRTCHGVLGGALRQALEELVLMGQQQQLSGPAVNGEEDQHDGSDDDEDGDGDERSDTMNASQAPPTASAEARLAPEMVEPILHSLGEAMAKTRRDRLASRALPANHSSSDNQYGVEVPRLVSGLVRGRVRHWNRRGTKWRVVVDAGAEIRPIRPSQRQPQVLLLGGRRQREGAATSGRPRWADRMSLWQAAAASNEQAMKLSKPLEVLAYNDRE
jgi:hypothetical protein